MFSVTREKSSAEGHSASAEGSKRSRGGSDAAGCLYCQCDGAGDRLRSALAEELLQLHSCFTRCDPGAHDASVERI